MKKTVTFLLLLSLSAFLMSCARQDQVLSSIGKYDKEEFYTGGGIQDFTDYAKYYYTNASLDENKYFSSVQKSDIEKLNKYVDNFESWIEAIKRGDVSNELAVNYDFDRSIIDTNDYLYIYDKMGTPIGESKYQQFDCYDVYFFDFQTKTLYYFHNNI